MYRLNDLSTTHSVTDRRTEDSIMPTADHTACRSNGRNGNPLMLLL